MSDKELIRITTQFTRGLLGRKKVKSMCFVATAPLQGFLSACGVETKLLEVEIEIETKDEIHIWNHFCLELEDGRILDPTANQFKTPEGEEMPNVYLGKKPKWYKTKK
jgi:hypothetical protein